MDGLGEGYVTPSIAQGKIFGASYRGDNEIVWARNEMDGSPLWEVVVAPAERDIGYPFGPRSTPTVKDNDLFTLGAGGRVSRLDVRDGTKHWQVDLVEQLNGKNN